MFGDRVEFVDVLIRQEHPGPGVRPYRRFDEKLRDGYRRKEYDAIPWRVLVDDLEGTVHRQYGMLADPSYLIGTDGRVAFYNYWTHAPTLYAAIDKLLAQGGRGVVGESRAPHLGAAMTDGWRAVRRGLPQSFIELEAAMPGFGSGPWLGYKLRPLLAPVTLRAKPLPAALRYAAALAATMAIAGAMAAALRPRMDQRALAGSR